MMPTKTVELDRYCAQDLLNAITCYSSETTCHLTREQYYRMYILKDLYIRLRRKQNVMYDNGKEKLRMKFDKVEALAIVDILLVYKQTDGLNLLMMELGKILPTVEKDTT
jgi:hypothetical protein